MWYSAAGLAEAMKLAEHFRASGTCDWFRGQTRNWPLLSSFGRLDDAGRERAKERLARFEGWLREVPQLAGVIDDVDTLLGIAQHYGIPTNLLDFTTEPTVAAFFAVHDPPEYSTAADRSTIVMVNTRELAEVWEASRIGRPQWPEFRRIGIDLPELWRIQAQRGVFLSFPFDEGFEKYVFDFDRICFPCDADPAEISRLIPEEDVYPRQKSDLEILLDQHFMLELLAEGSENVRRQSYFVVHVDSLPDGIEAECFGPAGLPEHDSWRADRLAAWSTPAAEHWIPISEAPVLRLEWPSGTGSAARRRRLAERLAEAIAGAPGCRAGPVRWEHVRFAGVDAEAVTHALSLLWDGLRRWPFTDEDVAHGLATAADFADLVAANPEARHASDLADALAARCLGTDGVIEVEIGTGDRSYTRGYAVPDDLAGAVRKDFAGFLNDEWRPRINQIWSILQVARNPRRVFRFEPLARVFARQVAATQVVLRGEATGKARLYNPARATSLGHP